MTNPINIGTEGVDYLYSLRNAGAVITGAGSGMGREISLLLARQGCKVVACDIDDDKLNKLL